MEQWDVIIIGAGPAGLTAGTYAARSGLKTLILEEKIPGGLALEAPLIENYPGFLGITGPQLVEQITAQAMRSGARLNQFEKGIRLDLQRSDKTVVTDKHKTYTSPAIILATGSHYKNLGVKGEVRLRGRGISYCALCDGPLFKGKRVAVVGGGNSAAMSALYLADIACNVKVIHRRNVLRAEDAYRQDLERRNVDIVFNTVVREIRGDPFVDSVVLVNLETGETTELQVDGVFIQCGEIPNTTLAKEAGVMLDENDYIIVDRFQRTTIEGVYAAGDVTNGPVKQIGTAIGQAIVAATETFNQIKSPYYFARNWDEETRS
jgi:thioredoxin reductase (NADPH)